MSKLEQKRSRLLLVIALIVVALALVQPVIAQSARPREASPKIYQQLPKLPLENQYVNRETGKVKPDSTLVERLINYHVYVKGRPTDYRLDWKLTIADYLDANELMNEAVYPGHDTLEENPMDGDRAAIKRLNREQRDALVQALVTLFNPNYPATTSTSNSPQPSTTPSPAAEPISPQS